MTRNDIPITGYFKEDVIGLAVYHQDKKIGQVIQIMKSKAHDILVIQDQEKKHLVPYIPQFVVKMDLEKKRMDIVVVEGLLNED